MTNYTKRCTCGRKSDHDCDICGRGVCEEHMLSIGAFYDHYNGAWECEGVKCQRKHPTPHRAATRKEQGHE